MKHYTAPHIRVIECRTDILCQSNPSEHEHGYNGNGNGKGWGQGGRPKGVFNEQDIYEDQ